MKGDHPDSLASDFQFALQRETQGAQGEANTIYERIVTSDEAGSVLKGACYFRLGWLAMGSKDYDPAAKRFQQAVAAFAENGEHGRAARDSLYWCAVSLEALGRNIHALDMYQRLVADEILRWDAAYRTIVCLDKLGRFEDALEACKRFHDLGENQDARVSGLRVRIDALQKQFEQLLADRS